MPSLDPPSGWPRLGGRAGWYTRTMRTIPGSWLRLAAPLPPCVWWRRLGAVLELRALEASSW